MGQEKDWEQKRRISIKTQGKSYYLSGNCLVPSCITDVLVCATVLSWSGCLLLKNSQDCHSVLMKIILSVFN